MVYGPIRGIAKKHNFRLTVSIWVRTKNCPQAYLTRRRIAAPGTTDYWINDQKAEFARAIGRSELEANLYGRIGDHEVTFPQVAFTGIMQIARSPAEMEPHGVLQPMAEIRLNLWRVGPAKPIIDGKALGRGNHPLLEGQIPRITEWKHLIHIRKSALHGKDLRSKLS